MASLTVKYLESLERRLRAGEKVKEWHPDGDGLYLRVLPSGRMSFELRRRPFKPFPIGPAAMGLPHARNEARKAIVRQAQGIDPAAERAAAKAAKAAERAKADETFGSIVERFIERYAKPELRTWKNIERGLAKDATPRWGDLPISEIRRKMVGELIDGIVDRARPGRRRSFTPTCTSSSNGRSDAATSTPTRPRTCQSQSRPPAAGAF